MTHRNGTPRPTLPLGRFLERLDDALSLRARRLLARAVVARRYGEWGKAVRLAERARGLMEAVGVAGKMVGKAE